MVIIFAESMCYLLKSSLHIIHAIGKTILEVLYQNRSSPSVCPAVLQILHDGFSSYWVLGAADACKIEFGSVPNLSKY